MNEDLTGLDSVINAITRTQGYGSTNSSLTDILRGPNTRNVGLPVQSNQDNQGYTFFPRPMCNLHPDNVAASRVLNYLADVNPKSMGSVIRQYLTTQKLNTKYGIPPSELVDSEQAFIDILGNTLKNLSGFPDHLATFFTSDEGNAKETYSWVDSRAPIYGSFDLSASFWNIDSDIVTKLLTAYHFYTGNIAYGTMVRFKEFIAYNIIDYQTRIYRIILDKTKSKVLKIACTGPAMFGTPADGGAFNYSSDNVLAVDNQEISVQIKFNSVRYNDPLIVDDFNRTVAFHNPLMHASNLAIIRGAGGNGSMVLLDKEEVKLMSNRSFPYIHQLDQDTIAPDGTRVNKGDLVLEWWCRAGDLVSTLSNASGILRNELLG